MTEVMKRMRSLYKTKRNKTKSYGSTKESLAKEK